MSSNVDKFSKTVLEILKEESFFRTGTHVTAVGIAFFSGNVWLYSELLDNLKKGSKKNPWDSLSRLLYGKIAQTLKESQKLFETYLYQCKQTVESQDLFMRTLFECLVASINDVHLHLYFSKNDENHHSSTFTDKRPTEVYVAIQKDIVEQTLGILKNFPRRENWENKLDWEQAYYYLVETFFKNLKTLRYDTKEEKQWLAAMLDGFVEIFFDYKNGYGRIKLTNEAVRIHLKGVGHEVLAHLIMRLDNPRINFITPVHTLKTTLIRLYAEAQNSPIQSLFKLLA